MAENFWEGRRNLDQRIRVYNNWFVNLEYDDRNRTKFAIFYLHAIIAIVAVAIERIVAIVR